MMILMAIAAILIFSIIKPMFQSGAEFASLAGLILFP